jgi:hypothetical protein
VLTVGLPIFRKTATANNQTIKQHLDGQMALVAKIKGIDQHLGECVASIDELAHPTTVQAGVQAQTMASRLYNSPWQPDVDAKTRPSGLLFDGWSDESTREFLHREGDIARSVAQSLEFESISHREAAIPKAALKTYEWVFGEPRENCWSNFPLWLEGPSDRVYWVTGKPGAGKSTLTKFILRDSRLRMHLGRWVHHVPLLSSTFFSWNAGTDLQRSQEGFMRTLLRDCIRQRPSLGSTLFPKRHAILQMWQKSPEFPWQLEELIDACRRLASGSGVSYKLFILVDGLDEFSETSDVTHDDLVGLLRGLNHYHGVKICVSSRPWNVFYDAFQQNPMLRMEELTEDDIRTFVGDQLSENEGFREIQELQQSEATELIAEVTSKAQGVFLWVTLVVRMLSKQLRDGDNLCELRKTLKDLPDDLSRFFQDIWSRIEPNYLKEASQLFQIKEASKACGLILYASTLWFSLDSAASCITAGGNVASWQPVTMQRLKRRLNSRTKGLLDVYNTKYGSRVDFLHRTAREWALSNWSGILSESDPDYDPCFALLQGEVLKISPSASASSRLTPQELSGYALGVLCCVSKVRDNPSQYMLLVQTLGCLEQGLAYLSRLAGEHGEGRPTLPISSAATLKLAFVHVLSQLAVVSYVKHTVQQTPLLLWHDRSSNMPSLLESVALGGNPDYWAKVKIPDRAETEAQELKRLELLDFITNKQCRRYLKRSDVQDVLSYLKTGPLKAALSKIPLKTLPEKDPVTDYQNPYLSRTAALSGCFVFSSSRTPRSAFHLVGDGASGSGDDDNSDADSARDAERDGEINLAVTKLDADVDSAGGHDAEVSPSAVAQSSMVKAKMKKRSRWKRLWNWSSVRQ